MTEDNAAQHAVICLDAEFADSTNNEILELYVCDLFENEVYHSYFRPVKTREWHSSERIHHITPAMVADKPRFDSCSRQLQSLFDNADVIIGFAPENDIRMLKANGIKGLDSKRVVNIRDWYWYCIGRHEDVDLYGGPGLSAVAERFSITFESGGEHSAGGDTLVTLRCFKALADIYRGAEGSCAGIGQTLDTISLFYHDFERACVEYRRGKAHGFLHFIEGPAGYKIKVNSRPEAEGAALTIEVADRHSALYDITKMIQKRENRAAPHNYLLKSADFERLSRYTNEYDDERSQFCRSLMRNQARLSF